MLALGKMSKTLLVSQCTFRVFFKIFKIFICWYYIMYISVRCHIYYLGKRQLYERAMYSRSDYLHPLEKI